MGRYSPTGWIRAKYAPHSAPFEESEGDEECSSATGCCMVDRESYLRQPGVDDDGDDPEDGSGPQDSSYEYQTDSEEEPLEYDSDCPSLPSLEGSDPELESRLEEAPPDPPERPFKLWPDPPEYDTEFVSLSTPLQRWVFDKDELGCYHQAQTASDNHTSYEHIAGPGCKTFEGYLGNRISIEEMRGCHAAQLIVMKKSNWRPRADDLEFERTGRYHLTGLIRRVECTLAYLRASPVRHDAELLTAEGIREMDHVEAHHFPQSHTPRTECGPPFHPTCFDIFRQASRRFLGRIDIDTLMRIRHKDAVEPARFPVLYHPHLFNVAPPAWHHMGYEYLAANPVFVPALKPILESALVSDEKAFSVHNSPFTERPRRAAVSRDLFLLLPIELILSIVSWLGSRDIAALRLASRAFTHLPISLWHQLILKEMPWLYEAWSSNPEPYYWATVPLPDEDSFDAECRRQAIDEELPEIFDKLLRDEMNADPPENSERHALLQLSPIKLPYHKTNWYLLYRDITVNWADLKGLRNRARIWDCVLQVIDAMKAAESDHDSVMADI